MAFYAIDPWGDQRADMRAARIAAATLQPHSKQQIDANELMLFPDDAHDLPDDADAQERQWMLKLGRTATGDE